MKSLRHYIYTLLLCAVPYTTPGHGDLHEQIAAVSGELARDPANSALYLKRANLYRQHREWKLALEDLNKAKSAEPEQALYLQGVTLSEAGRPDEAKPLLDELLRTNPKHGFAVLTRARVSSELAQFASAAKDYEAAANLLTSLDADFYLEWARVLTKAENPNRALTVLDQGVKNLGPLPGLELCAIEIEQKRGQHSVALERLSRLQAKGGRQIKWNALKGQILLDAKKEREALEAFHAALAEIEALPAGQQQHWAKLKQQISAHIEKVKPEKI